MNAQSLENPYASQLRISVAILVLIIGALLSTMVPPWKVIAPIAGAAFIWVIVQRPTSILGLFLAWMPIEFLAVMSGRFFGLPLVDLVSKSKEPLLFLLVLILWQRNGFRLTGPDWFLLGLFTIAGIHKAFGGDFYSFQDDFVFALPYLAGRVTVLTAKQQHQMIEPVPMDRGEGRSVDGAKVDAANLGA